MAFHCIALAISLVGMAHARRTPPSLAYSYGTDRIEVLAAFSNSLMMLFVCLFVLAGALHRLVEGAKAEEVGSQSNALFFFGLLGAAVNAAGVMSLGSGVGSWQQVARFQGSSSGGAAGYPSSSSSSSSPQPTTSSSSSSSSSSSTSGGGPSYNSRAVFLHVYADAVSSLAVVASALVQKNFGLTRSADTLCAVFVALFTLNIAVPLFSATGHTLLQTTPQHLRAALERARREALTVEGVLEVYDERWWTQSPGVTVGSVVVRVRDDADETAVLRRVQRAYKVVTDLTVQVEKDAPLAWLQGGAGGDGGGWDGVKVDGPDSHHGHSHGHGGSCSGGGAGGDDHHGHSHGGHGGSCSGGAGGDDHHGHSHDHGGHSHR
jgi:cation diffusion facilitator family transporter